MLPHGSGKVKFYWEAIVMVILLFYVCPWTENGEPVLQKFRVAVFAEGDAAEEAREAGATQVGGLDFIEEIKKGEMIISLKASEE